MDYCHCLQDIHLSEHSSNESQYSIHPYISCQNMCTLPPKMIQFKKQYKNSIAVHIFLFIYKSIIQEESII